MRPIQTAPVRKSNTSFTLSPTISTATIVASDVSQRGATSAPSLARLAVNSTSGTTAKGSWKLSTTWLRMSSLPVCAAPNRYVTASAGTSAMPRVISRRITADIRSRMKPSITICPAIVAVTVELSPHAMSAMPNSSGAIAVPRIGVSSSRGARDLAHHLVPRVEGRGRKHQQRSVDRQREGQRERRVPVENPSASRFSASVSP